MPKSLPTNENAAVLTIQQAAEFLHLSTKTLRRWEKQGLLVAVRTPGNQRRYTLRQLKDFQDHPRPVIGKLLPPETTQPVNPNSNLPTGKLEPPRPSASSGSPSADTTIHAPISPTSPHRFYLRLTKYALILLLLVAIPASAFSIPNFSAAGLSAISQLQHGLSFFFPPPTSSPSLPSSLSQLKTPFRPPSGSVLAEQTSLPNFSLLVNVPAVFASTATISGTLTAPNIVYQLLEGSGISISGDPQNPLISVTDPGSAQEFFGNIAVGTTTISADQNNDTLTLAAGANVSIASDPSTKKITISATDTVGLTGTIGVANGGTGLTSYTTGDLIYASATNTLARLAAGSDGSILTISAGIPTWVASSGSSCSGNCVITNPSTTQTITPSAAVATGLRVAQALGGSTDIFSVTNHGSSTKYFFVDSTGQININSDIVFSTSSPTISINNNETLSITDGSNTLLSLIGGATPTLTVNTLSATNISGFNLTGNIVGIGSPNLSGLGSINGGNITGGTYNGATITGGTMSGGTLTGGTWSASGGTVTGSFTATIGDGNSFLISDGTHTLLSLVDQGTGGTLVLNGPTDITTTSNSHLIITANGTGDIVFITDADTTFSISNLVNCDTIDTDANGVLTCGTDADSGSTLTLQNVYDNDPDGSNSIISLTSFDDSIVFRNPASSGTDTTFLFQLDQLASSGVDALLINQAGTGSGLTLTLSNSSGTRANGILISQTHSGTTTNALNIIKSAGDIVTGINIGAGLTTGINLNSNTLIDIGNPGTDFDSSGGLTLAGSLTANGQFTLGDGGDPGSIDTSDWDISATGVLSGISGLFTDGGYTQTGSSANTFSGVSSFTAVNPAGGSANALTLSGTLGVFDGSDTFRGLYLNYTNANHTGTGNTFTALEIAGITADAEAAETAIVIGSGWDNDLVFNKGAHSVQLRVNAPSGATRTLTIPTLSADVDLCHSGGNCAGAGGGITGSGTIGQIAFFNGSGTITSETSGFGWNTTTKFLSLTGSGEVTYSPAGTVTAATAFRLTPTFGIDTTDQTLTGLLISPNTNSNTDPGDILYGLNLDNITAASGPTETALRVGSGWENLFEFEGSTNDNFEVYLRVTDPTADQTITFPDDTGVVCLSSGNCAGSAGGSKWTDAGSITYLTSTSDNLAVGGTTLASAFSVNVSSNLVRIGTGSSANAQLDLYASDGDTGSLVYNTSDQFHFTGGDVLISQALTLAGSLTANGQFTLGDGGDPGSIDTSDWDISATGVLSGISGLFTDGGYTQTGSSANTFSGVSSFTAVNPAGGSANALTLSGTLGVFDGSDTFRGLYLNYTNANHTGTGNTFTALEIAGITADAEAAETAIVIGSGWDNDLVFNKGAHSVQLRVNAPSGATRTLTIPTLSADVDLCHSGGNCAGAGGGITGSGTIGQIAFFNGSGTITSETSGFGWNTTTKFLSLTGSGEVTYSPAGTVTAATAFRLTPTFGIDTTDQTLTGLLISPNTNSNTDPGDILYGLNLDNITAASGPTETALRVGSGWENLFEFEGSTNDNFEVYLRVTDPTADQTITFPDDTGVVCLSSGNCAGSAGGSKWTDAGSITYLTSTSDNLAVGGTTLASAFSVNVSSNLVRIGTGSSANAQLDLYASDGDTGSLVYNTSDQFHFTGGDVLISQALTLAGSLTANGQFTLGDGGDPGSIDTSDWDISATGVLSGISGLFTDGGYTQTGSSANTFSGVSSFTAVNPAGGSANALTLSGTLGVFDGSDTFRGLYLNYTNANHTGTGNTFTALEIAGITADAEAAETAIVIGSGWDNDLVFNKGAHSVQLRVNAPSGATRTLTIPTLSADVDLCHSGGNCAGAGGGITGSGTIGQIAFFNGSGTITSETSGFGWNTTTKFLSLTGSGEVTYSPAGTVTAATAFRLTPTFGIDTTDQTLTGLLISPNTNSNTDPGDILYGLNLDNITAASGPTETALRVGSGWENLFEFEGSTNDNFEVYLRVTDPTADQTITFPDDTGVVCLSSGNCAGSAGGSKWTDAGSITYLTSTSDNLAVGGTTLASAFSVNVSSNLVRIGTGSSANAQLDLYASDGDTGSLVYNTSDQFHFTGGDVLISQALTLAGSLTANGQFTLGDGGDPGSIDTSDWDISATGVLSGISGLFTDGGYTQTGSSANTFSGVSSFTAVNPAGGSANALTLSGTLGVFDGSDTFRGLYLNYTNANHTGTGNTFTALEIAGITADAEAAETAIVIGSGWDNVLSVNGVVILNSSGQLLTTNLTGTLFSTSADSGTGTIVQGETLAIVGGTNGIDTSLSGDTYTLNLDTTEIGSSTFGSGSGFTWTFDASSGTDTTIAFGNNTQTFTTATATFTGNLTIQGTTGLTLSGTGADLIFANSERITNDTDSTITFVRNDTGTVTLTAADDDTTAALTILSGGAAALTLDSGGTAAVLIANSNASSITLGRPGITTTNSGALTISETLTANGIVTLGDGGDSITLNGTTLTFTANGAGNDITFNLVDNNTDAFDLQEGANNYLNINTTNGSENIAFGNSATNPSFSFLGTGTLTITGDLTVNGGDFLFRDGTNTLITFSDLGTAGGITFPNTGYLDLGNITHSSTAIQGLRLPQANALSNPSSGKGYLAYDADDNLVVVYNGSNWVSISGASTTLQDSYNNDPDGSNTSIILSAADDSLVITNPSSSGTDSAFTLQINQFHPTAAITVLDLTQSSNNANAVNLTANSIDNEIALNLSTTGLTTGSSMRITGSGATMATGGELIDLVLGANTVGAGITITSTGTYTGTGAADGLLNIVANSLTTGDGAKMSFTGLTSGTGLEIIGGTAMTANGELLDLNMGAATAGNGLNITTTGVYTGTGLAVLTANSATSGTGINLSLTGLTTGTGLAITGGSSMASGSELIDLNMGAATAGNGLNITTTGVYTGTGLAVLTANSATSGTGINLSLTGLTTGTGLAITGGSSMASGSELIDLNMGAATAGTGLRLTTTGAYTGTGTSDGIFNLTANSLTTGYAAQIFTNGLTSGRSLNISSTSTTLTTGSLLYLDWSPGSTTTATGDLFRLNIGASGNIGNLFHLTDNGSTLFSVGETLITSAIPHAFTAAGDVSLAYDLQFTNQTASFIKSNASLEIQSGESFENNHLRFLVYGTGQVITSLGTGYSLIESTSTSVDGTTATNLNVAGQFITTNDLDTISLLVRNANTGVIAMANVGTSGAQGDPGVLTIEGAGSSTTAYNLITAYNSTTRSDASAVFRVRADGNVYGEAAFNSSGADYAEWFPKEEDVLPGELVGMNPQSGKVRKFRPGDTLVGVVSANPGFVGNNMPNLSDDERDASYELVGIVGQLPVKVSNTNGPIHVGDPITTSTIAGTGVKATSTGQILGRAMQSLSGDSATILVYVNQSWYDPHASRLAFDENGHLVVTGNIQAQDFKLTTPVNQLDSLKTSISHFEAQISSLQSQSANLITRLTQVETTLDNLTLPDQNWQISPDSGKLITALSVQVPQLTVTGQLSVGLLSFDDITSDISSLTGLLSLQNGSVTIDQLGHLTAAVVTAQKFNVDTTNVLGASVGKITIPAGLTQVTVETTAVSTSSSIFVTPELPVPISAAATQSGRFVINIPAPQPQDLKTSWWVIN